MNHGCGTGVITGRCEEVEALSPEHFDRASLQTALHVAAANDHAGAVSILIRAGVRTDAYDMFVTPPMHITSRYDSADALRTLLEAKASVNKLTS